MEPLLDHLKAVIATLSGSLPDLKHFIKDYKGTKDTAERLKHLRVTLKLDRWALPEIQPTSDEYSSGALIIELLQGALEFSLANGFLYKELGPFLTLYLHTLGLVAYNQQSADVSLTVVQTNFKSAALEYSSRLARVHLLSSVLYIKDTIFKHYELYRYLLTQEQPLDLTTIVKVDLPFPVSPLPLTDAQQQQEFIKKQEIASLESIQQRQAMEFREVCESVSKQEKDRMISVYETELAKVAGLDEISEEDVKSLVESLATAHFLSAKVDLSQTVQRQAMILEMKTEKLELLTPKHEPTLAKKNS